MKKKPDGTTQTPNGGSVQRMVRHSIHPSETQNESVKCTSDPETIWPNQDSSLVERADASWSLLQLLDMLSCRVARNLPLARLARTNRARRELLALANLWKSLGHPVTGFWRETRVFYNCMEWSYLWMPNDKAEPPAEKP